MKKATSFFLILAMIISFSRVAYANIPSIPTVKINEVCSSNGGTNGNTTGAVDNEGKYLDWVELYNATDKTVDLSGFGLSDKEDNPFKCTISSGVVIAPKSFLVIYCSKAYAGDATKPNVAINISADGETVLLTAPDSSYTDKVTVPALAKDTVYARIPDGSNTFNIVYPTPSSSNSDAASLPSITAPSFSHKGGMYSAPFSLRISSNAGTTVYYTRDGSDPRTSSTRVVYTKELAINDVTGQRNVLSNKNSDEFIGKANVIRAVAFKNNEYSWITTASYFLGANNKTYGNMPIVSLVTDSSNLYDHSKGIYIEGKRRSDFIAENKFTSGSQLKFTLPNISAGTYKLSVVTLNGSGRSSYITYVNSATIGKETPTTGSGQVTNEIGSFDLADQGNVEVITEVKTAGTTSIYVYQLLLTDSSGNVKTFAASDCTPLGRKLQTEEFISSAALVKTTSNIKIVRLFESDVEWNSPANYNGKGREWERECSFEFFEDDGSLQLSQDCGIRIQGGYSRIASQKSFRVIARNDYGPKNFNYSFFDDAYDVNEKKIDKYKSLVIRNGGNDNGDTKFTDSYYQELMRDRPSIDTQYSRPVMIYIDGEFWGLYHIYEDYSADYIGNKYNVDEDDVVMIKNGDIDDGEDQDMGLFDEMYNFIMNNDMKVEANYQRACTFMDMDSYINYLGVQFAISNGDWPGGNHALWRTKTIDSSNKYSDGKWRWMLFDTDRSGTLWGDERYNSGRYNKLMTTISDNTKVTNMIVKLKENAGFKQKFSTAFADIINVNLDCYAAMNSLTELNDYFVTKGRMLYQWKRFGGGQDMYNRRYNAIVEFINGRKGYVANGAGAGAVSPITISSNYPNGGLIKLNTSTIDLTKFEYDEFWGKYGVNYPLNITATPKSGYEFVRFEGDVTSENATISVTMNKAKSIKAIYKKINGVYINEVCSSNSGTNNLTEKDSSGGYCDWIELYNSTNSDVDLSDWGLSDNDSLFKTTIKSGTVIKAGGYLIVYCSKDYAGDTSKPNVAINISADGETLTLSKPDLAFSDKVKIPELLTDTTYARKPDGDNIMKVVYPTPQYSNNNSELIKPEVVKEAKPVYKEVNDDNFSFTTIEDFEDCTPAINSSNSKIIDVGNVTQYIGSGNAPSLSHNTITTEYVNPTTQSKKALKFTGSAGWESYCFGYNLTASQLAEYDGIRVWVKGDTSKLRKVSLSMKIQYPTYTSSVSTDSDISTMTTNNGHWQYIIWGDNDPHIWQNRVTPLKLRNNILQVNFNFAPNGGNVVYLDDFQLMKIKETPVLKGDANKDGQVNAKDVLLIRRHVTNWPIEIDIKAADVYEDSQINAKDVLKLRQYMANLITTL